MLSQTPSAFRQFLQVDVALSKPLQLQRVILAGEAVNFSELQDWFARHARSELVNMHGITETTVYDTLRTIREDDCKGSASIIGRPLADLRAYVLDGDLGLVPTGVTGELYLSGDGVARGYLERPELTAQRFIANPYGPAGSRLYRSGDLARWRAEGELEFLGRIDQQVKIRGYRIELGEIEAALLERGDVREAIVLAREDVPGERQLVAYVVTDASVSVGADELRAHLGRRLPGYMVPAFFVQLESLPLTANGKIDRNALPLPQSRVERPGYVAPRTPIEQTLSEIWAEVLHVQRVGIHDNFFELGGHSLLALQAIARINNETGSMLSLHQLFDKADVSSLAMLIVPQSPDSSHESGVI
jgi:acyl-coenzyme A synthetase/AMP-(fatty) acid ligase